MIHQQFHKFIANWHVYKCIRDLPVEQIPNHLYSACDEALQHSLIHSYPNFLDMDECTMLHMVEHFVMIVDDTLLYDTLIEEYFFHQWDYLTLHAENGIVINESFSYVKTLLILQILLLLPTVLCHLRNTLINFYLSQVN